MTGTTLPGATSDEWCARHFDHLSPAFAATIHETLGHLREHHPVTWSDQHGGFWVVTRYEDVLRVVQDWQTFSSAQGVNVPPPPAPVNAIPEVMDPPRHREFKRLVNAWFTPAVVRRNEAASRAVVTRLIDAFVDDGRCVAVARTATRDAAVGGRRVEAGHRVLVSWAAANRDEREFPEPRAFDPGRESNRHLSFGAGPHRCAGSHLARMNLHIAVEEIVTRLHELCLDESAGPVHHHQAQNRCPEALFVTFRPGARA